MLFAWLRKMVRDAFLAGVNDGVQEITADESGAADGVLLRLKLERPAALAVVGKAVLVGERKRKG